MQKIFTVSLLAILLCAGALVAEYSATEAVAVGDPADLDAAMASIAERGAQNRGNGQFELDEPLNVAYCLADPTPTYLDGFLQQDDRFSGSHFFDCRYSFPTLDDLMDYDVVIAWSNYGWYNNGGAGMGDLLADYIDAGGAVVICTFALISQTSLGVVGRMQTDGYLPFVPGNSTSSGAFVLGEYDETHPIMDGVTTGQSQYCNIGVTVAEDGYLVASYTNQYPLVIAKQAVVGVNLFAGLTYYTGDLPHMVLNAMVWAVNSLGSSVSGQVTNAVTQLPIEGAVVNFYDADADTLWGSDTTDAEGMYECPTTFPEGFVADMVASKPLFLDYTETGIQFGEPEDIVMNVAMTPFLQTDIEALQTEVPIGTWVDVTGIVTIPTNTIDTEHTSFYIQDETMYGIHIFDNPAWTADDLNRGDEVRIVGQLNEYDDITEISSLYLWEVISTGNPMFEPLDMPTGTMSAMQEMEGTWAHIEGYIQEDPAQMGSYTLNADDGSGWCQVRIYGTTDIDLTRWVAGDWLMFNGVISLYEYEVQITPAFHTDITRTWMDTPVFTRVSVEAEEENPDNGVVTFAWDHTGYGPIGFLSYDGGPPSDYFAWPGHLLGVHFSPAMENSRLIALRFYINTENGGTFDIVVNNWLGEEGRPGNQRYIEYPVEVDGHFQGWYDIIISDENVRMMGDFVVSFSCDDNSVRLGKNPYNNGRGWDYDPAMEEWEEWTESYFIRSVVQYAREGNAMGDNGEGELDSWRTFNVYRNGVKIDSMRTTTSFTEVLTDSGHYQYSVSAVYNEGETEVTMAPEVIEWRTEQEESVGENNGELPMEFAINSIFPNPFNPVVNVSLAIPVAAEMKVEVFDLLGRSVAVLAAGKMEAGYRNLTWHASGTSGIYFLKATSGTGWSDIRKLVYMK